MKNSKNGKQIDLKRVSLLFKGIQDYLESRYIDIVAKERLFSSLENIPLVPDKSFLETYYEETIKILRKNSEFEELEKIVNNYFGIKPSDFLPEDYFDGKLLTWLKTRQLINNKLFHGDTNDYTTNFLSDFRLYKKQRNKCKVYYALEGILFPNFFSLKNIRTASKEELFELSDACDYITHYKEQGEAELNISISSDSIKAKDNYGYLVSKFQYNIVGFNNIEYERLIDRISFELSILRLSCKHDFSVHNIYVFPLNRFDWDSNLVFHSNDYSKLMKNAYENLDHQEWLECVEKSSLNNLDPIFDLLQIVDVNLKNILPQEIKKSIRFFSTSSELAKNYNSIPFAFLRLITSLEQIMNPNSQIEQLKVNFSNRFNYLVPENIIEKWGTDIGIQIYQFRNELVHGGKEEIVIDAMTVLPVSLNGISYSDIRGLARVIILRVVNIYNHIYQKNEFAEFLLKNLEIDKIPTKWKKLVNLLDRIFSDKKLVQKANSILDSNPL